MTKSRPRKSAQPAASGRNTAEAVTDEKMQSHVHEFRERITGLASDYACYVLVPRILADRRRRAGDSAAAPADYYCQCLVDPADAIPLCEGRRAECKFAHRQLPPGPYRNLDRLRFSLHRAEQDKILKSLPFDDFDRLLEEIRLIDRKIETEFQRIRAATGRKISRNITGWL